MKISSVEATAVLSLLNQLDIDHPVATARLRKSTIIAAIEDYNMVTISFHDVKKEEKK